MSRDNLLIDSNILVYAINLSSPKHKSAQQFITDKQKHLVVAQQNILECLRVLTHPKFSNPMTIDRAVISLTNITDALRLITPDESSIHLALMLFKEYKLTGDKIFDAHLAATALSNNVSVIATDNERDFKKFKAITVLNPFK